MLDNELYCQILVKIGSIYMELRNFECAKWKFNDVLTHCAFCDVSITQAVWQNVAVQKLRIIRKQEEEVENQRIKFNDDIRAIRQKFDLGIESFVSFILVNHPPRHFASFNEADWKDQPAVVSRKTLLKFIQGLRF